MALGHRNYRKIRSRNRRKKGMWPLVLAAVGLWAFASFSSLSPAQNDLPVED